MPKSTMCDGAHTVEAMVDQFGERWKLSFFEARGMILTVLRKLMKDNLVVLVPPDSAPVAADGNGFPPENRRLAPRRGNGVAAEGIELIVVAQFLRRRNSAEHHVKPFSRLNVDAFLHRRAPSLGVAKQVSPIALHIVLEL